MNDLQLMILLYSLIFLSIVGLIVRDFLRSKYNREDEYDVIGGLLERYTTITYGDPVYLKKTKDQYEINVNFKWYIITDQFIYLFDRHKKLFALCDKTQLKTYQINSYKAMELIGEYESQLDAVDTVSEYVLQEQTN